MVGTPPQRVSVILDTGSGVCAYPCASCKHCWSPFEWISELPFEVVITSIPRPRLSFLQETAPNGLISA